MPLPDSFWIILTAELSGRYCDDYQRQPTDRHPGLLFPVVLSPSGGRIRLRPQSHELPSGKPRQSVPGGGGRNCILDMRGSLILVFDYKLTKISEDDLRKTRRRMQLG